VIVADWFSDGAAGVKTLERELVVEDGEAREAVGGVTLGGSGGGSVSDILRDL